jgi:hypothetical protein
MLRRLLFIVGTLLLSVYAAPAQTPSPDAMAAARSLVVTMRQADQYRALLPEILLALKPASSRCSTIRPGSTSRCRRPWSIR